MKTAQISNFLRLKTVPQTLIETADGRGGDICLSSGRDSQEKISRGELLTRSCAAARLFRENGIEPGERVLSILPTGKAFLVATFGAWFAGGVIVPVAPLTPGGNSEKYREKFAAMIRVAAPRVIIGTHQTLAASPGLKTAFGNIKFLTGEDILNYSITGEPAPLYEPQPEDFAHIQFTSGSTGFPKGASVTHGNLAANLRGVGRAMEVRENDKVVSWLPVHHDMGFVGGIMFSIIHNSELHLIPTENFIRDPAIWLQTISRTQATLSPAPTFAYDLLASRVKENRLESVDLSSWRYAWVGAEPIFENTLRQFNERFRRYGLNENVLHPCYGLAEATVAVTQAPLNVSYKSERIKLDSLRSENYAQAACENDLNTASVISCGTPISETEIKIVTESGATLDERRQGRVLVRGASVMRGYFNQTEQPFTADGWLDTGDLGFLLGGELYITGRAKDLIIRGGVNIHPQEIECAAQTVAGVRVGRTAAFSIINHKLNREEIVIAVETREKESAARAYLVEAITREIIKQAGVCVDRVELTASGFIPKTTSGKIQRNLCREKFLNGAATVSI